MVKNNELLWKTVEGLAVNYAKASDPFNKETILLKIYEVMKTYINSCVKNSVAKSRNNGLNIPKEDFESRYMQYLWEALEAFEADGKYSFKNIVLRRFRFAEAHTWRQYKTKGTENDKDGISYVSARWDSLDRTIGGDAEDKKTLADIVLGDTVSAENEFLENNEVNEIIDEFTRVNERYANIIRLISLGYEGESLALASGESTKYDAKMRKLVQRSKEAFGKFISERKDV